MGKAKWMLVSLINYFAVNLTVHRSEELKLRNDLLKTLSLLR
jgi:hypothetical protein